MTAGRDGFLLHEHLEAQARSTPNVIALRHDERSITFAQLEAIPLSSRGRCGSGESGMDPRSGSTWSDRSTP